MNIRLMPMLACLFVASIGAMNKSLIVEKDGMQIHKNKHGFSILKNGTKTNVHSFDVDKDIRSLSRMKLKTIKHTLVANRMNNGDYALRMQPNLQGGGVIAGAIAYWATKTLCYGTAVAAAGGAVVATGGTAGAVTGALTAAGTMGASTGVTVVSGAIAGAGLTTEAVTATAAVIGGSGGVAAAMASIETASLGMASIFTAIPFLP